MPKEPFIPVLYAATFENIFTTLAVGRAVQCSDGKFFQFCESILLLEVYIFRNFMCVQNKSKIKVSLKSNIQRIQKNPKNISSLYPIVYPTMKVHARPVASGGAGGPVPPTFWQIS